MLRLVPFVLAAASLSAQSVVVPNASATTAGTLVLNNPLRNSGNPRTYMLGINASQLAAIPVGSLIVGISMRAGLTTTNPAVWPATDVTFTDYEVRIGDVLPPSAWSTTFLSNFVGTPVLARDGAMVVQANAFTNSNPTAPTPNAWGTFFWDFQVPFVYHGGDLGIQMTHPGSTSSTSIFFEQVASNVGVHGQAITNSSFQAVTASTSTYAFTVTRIHYGYGSPTGCPGTNGMTPMLVQDADTNGGGTLGFAIANAPANSVGVFVFGLGRATIPTPNGCDLLMAPISTSLALLDLNGRGTMSIAVPPGVTAQFQVQAAVLDAGNAGGYTLSNGVEPTAN